jgi:RNA polymerase sigma factor FliA
MPAGVRLTPDQAHLVTSHRKLAYSIAEDYWRRSNDNLDMKETISIAYQGLVTAALRFDPEWRPDNDPNYQPFLAFGSFAKRRITGAILDWMRQQDHVPRRQRQTYKKLQAQGHGSGRTPEELADITGVPADRIREIVSAVESASVSFDDTWEHKEETIDHVESEVSTATVLKAAADAVAAFPEAQQDIIYMRYFYGFDFGTIAAELGVAVANVRVMHHEAMLILHDVYRNAADS